MAESESESERGGLYVRLNPDESPMTMVRITHSSGSRSLVPSASHSEHYVRKKSITKYSAAWKSLIPFKRNNSIVTELPLDNIGFMSMVTYGWMSPFMRKSWSVSPNESLSSAKLDSCNVNSQRLKELLRDENVKRGQLNARILCTAWRFVRTRVLISTVINILSAAMSIIALVFFLTWFLESKEIYNLLILILLFCVTLILQFWSRGMTFRTANRLQSAFMSIMYKHLLRASVLHSVSAHRIVSVMIADSEKIHEAVTYLPIVIAVPIVLLLPIAMFLVKLDCYSVQDSIFALSTLILLPPILYLLARLSNVWKSCMSLFTGKRMKSLQEMLLHLTLVKMTLREKLFHKNSEDLRKKECQYLRKVNLCDGFSITFLHIVPLLLAVLLWHQSKTNNEILRNKCEKANLFSVIILLLLPLKELLFNFWYGMTKILDGMMALRRLKRVLVLTCISKTSSRKPINHLIALSVNEATYAVKIGNSASDQTKRKQKRRCMRCRNHDEDEAEVYPKTILKGICLAAPKEKLIGICGDASSGKTALIFAILEQISPSYGADKLQKDGSYAYVGQNPWILNGTFQENILFNETFVPKKYYNIIHCCSLNDDIGMLPGGDHTLITESMLTLGLKQRIALARALYSNRDIYLLDDFLSAVNSDLGLTVFERALQHYLKNKTVIMTSRQVKFLRFCDEIFVLKRGEIVENGTHDDLMEKQLYPILIKSYLQEKYPSQLEKMKSSGSSLNIVHNRVDQNTVQSVVKIPDSVEEEGGAESTDMDVKFSGSISFFKNLTIETQTSVAFIASLLLRIMCIILLTISPILILKYFLTKGLIVHLITLGLLFLIIFSRVTGIILYEKVTYTISLQIHETWIENICKCCLNIFQNASHSEVLRWFSTHLSEIDDTIPSNSVLLLENAFLALLLVAILSLCSFWFLIPIMCIFFLGYFLLNFTKLAIDKFYQQEEGACSHLNEFMSSSIMGRVTIQAYGREQEYWTQFHGHCNKLLAYFQLRKASLSWLTFWIHIISLIFCMIVLGSLCIESQLSVDSKKWLFTLHDEDHIAIILIFSGILFGYILNNVIQSCTNISSKFTVLGNHDATIRGIQQEEDDETVLGKERIPFPNGRIDFQNVKLEFWPDSQPSFRGLSFCIQAGEKIGILGLPGSGKTAIIGALFRLVKLSQGMVHVGGIDLASTSIESVRSSIALVPKNPVLFSGTLRLNIDPMLKHSLRELNECLEKVGLTGTVNDLLYNLETHTHTWEGRMSTEERQLVYVAQAVLRDPKILILEEPIQPIGAKNMFRVQDVVSQLFHCTIVIVANNMKYASKCDKIIIVKDGQVVEFDTPENLFRNPNSCFSQMLFSNSDNSFETEV